MQMSSRSLGLLTLQAVDSSADMLSSPPTLVGAHQFALSKEVTLHGAQQFCLGRAGLQRQFGVQCVKFEVIAMQFSRWRAWSAVAYPFEIVHPLFGTTWQRFRRTFSFSSVVAAGRS